MKGGERARLETEWRRFREWQPEGKDTLVKVIPFQADIHSPKRDRIGYVTLQRFIFGLTPRQIETVLGLRPFWLFRGCKVYKLKLLPQGHQIVYRGGADQPGGGKYDHEAALQARHEFITDPNMEVVPYYPKGKAEIPQWEIMVKMPVELLTNLMPSFTYPNTPY
jgi:hypothetical protein